MSFSLIILAGGNSHRFRSNVGKPYQKIAGKSLVEINVDKARQFKQIKKIMQKYITADYIVSGSLRNNKLPMKEPDYSSTGSIGFISRFTPAILKSLDEKNDNNPDYIVHKFSSKLLCNTAEYCRKFNKKLMIL